MKTHQVAEVEAIPTMTARSRNLRLGRTLLALGLAAGLLVGAPTSHASAAVTLTNGASAWTTISCNPIYYSFDYTVNMKPQSGFSSQYVAFAFYLQPTSGAVGAWSPWLYGIAPMEKEAKVTWSGSFTVYVRYAWWNGSSWTYFGEWIKTYTEGDSGWRTTQAYCQV